MFIPPCFFVPAGDYKIKDLQKKCEPQFRIETFNFECLSLGNVERPFHMIEVVGEASKLPFDLHCRKNVNCRIKHYSLIYEP
ncbi:hypothetical protein RV13_GL003259 [Enterococcus raffinosus]|nr:hypothetical protein RV13_GL003259 [Enterococcus raffinosus]